ncbi:PAS domain-containing sensor histidine kinase [Hyalangium rubrum]|uniref:histidine kinase n=1 Tax=Hyalangium rubrum TaxID=3103134 RepID=A0ABU5H9V0_9BACT|nr:PAS domain-containing protein [Hyalangium sp. s54d21]MDY7230268.1 PAS domain-containing protein [Hyalangium sp. s54d21]
MSPRPPVAPLQEFIERLLLIDRALQVPVGDSNKHEFIERLLVTVDTAPVLLSYIDASERYRFCNQAYERWFGGSRERTLGRTMREVLGEAAYEQIRAEVHSALSGKHAQFERVVPYDSGGTRTVLADYLPHVLPDGRVAGFVAMVSDVSEQRRCEATARMAQALRESEERLRLALWASELGIWDYEPIKDNARWDERCRELLGVLPEEPLTRDTFLRYIHPEDQARVEAAMQAAFDPDQGGCLQLEYRVAPRHSKAERWLQVHGKMVFEARRPSRFTGTLRDITQSRLARVRVDRLYAVSSALSQALLPDEVARVVVSQGALALEAASASLVLVSEDGTAFELRAAHGFPTDSLESLQRFPIDTPVMYREAYRSARPVFYESLEHLLRDYPVLRDSPALVGRSFAALPLRVDERVIGAFGFTFAYERAFTPEDMQFMESLGQQCAMALERSRLYAAERKARAEAEQLRDRLAAERSLLTAVMDQLPVGVVIAEPGGRLLRGNAAMENVWGHAFRPSASIPQYSEYQGYHPDGRPYLPEEWPLSRSLLHGETVLREPVTAVHENGERRQIDLSSTLVRDAEGRPVAGVVVSTDVTQHQRMKEALQREAEVREKLLGIVSHDLRNPLQAIFASSQLLLRAEALTPSQQKKAERIQTSVRRMDRLIRDLLDFARARGEGSLPIQRRRASLEDACRPILEELQAAHPGRSLLLETRGDMEGEWDVERLAQLVGNLVTNALKHGAAEAPIQLRVDGEGPQVVLEVANQGRPIPTELLPRVFEPFTRASTGGDALKGVGLGLFIVHEIVAAHGGNISVNSTAEAGTVFRVVLPRRLAAA